MKLMLDTIEYRSKPVGKRAGSISNRIIKNPVDISIEELAKNLVKGKTFIPAYFREKEGIIKRNKEYWHSQEIIALDFDDGMTLDEAVKEFSNTACFIYTTFSHTEEKHKFRVVFMLDRIIHKIEEFDEIISGLITKYPQADKHCTDCTRLFYGGKEIILLNYNNRLVVNDYVKNNPNDSGGTKKNLVIYPAKNTKQIQTNECKQGKETADNIELIQQRNIKELRAKIRTKPKIVYNNFELFNYLKQQDLRAYLGIQHKQNFLDIFHEESNPSASIYQSNKGNEHQLYKCFSTSHPFVGTIIQVTERLLECSILEVKAFLMELYQVEIKESEQQKELKLVIDIYKELLQSDDLEELYPNFYKVFNRYNYLQDMYVLLDLVKEYLPSGEDPRLLFYHSLDTLSKRFNKSKSITHTRMNFLTFFELISKLNTNEIPKELYDSQLKSKRKKGHKYLNSTYELKIYGYEFFNRIDDMCALWIEKGCTTKTMNYEGILRNFGRVEADRVFPQDKGKVIPSLNKEIVHRIHKTTLEFIEYYGWTTEQEVLENVTLYFKGQKTFKQNQFKICFGELLDGYDLERVRLTKELKEKLKIEGKGYGFIIKRREYIEEIMIDTPESYENHGIFD
ncbi:hypothetical protein BAOM_1387 [Peribacillus asahii]|uniref:Primase C-terminal 1 domain-containing protein n=1 Tax=Peribacillus asahii TaxID=228899 RepID=A0A3T0KNR3_9BACI|nr:hypothetical protein [Peribacillus asahii]AZV41997.1 hypothetical protein BAOM_1387 [Peribacillus asahii]